MSNFVGFWVLDCNTMCFYLMALLYIPTHDGHAIHD